MRKMSDMEARRFLTTATRTGKLAVVRADGSPMSLPSGSMWMFSYIALLVWLGTDGPGPLSLDRLSARLTQLRGLTAAGLVVRRAAV